MPTPFEILITARDQASGTIKSIDGALAQLDNTAKKTSTNFEQAGARSENFGRAISRGVQIASNSLDILAPAIGKISPQLDSAIRAAQQFGGAMSLAFSFGPAGLAIGGVAAGIGLMIQYLQQQHDALVKVIDVRDPYIASIRAMAEANRTLFSKEDTAKVDEYIKKIEELKARQIELASSSLRAAGPGGALGLAYQQQQTAGQIKQTEAELENYIRGLVVFQNQLNVTAGSEALWRSEMANTDAQYKQNKTDIDAMTSALAAFAEMQGQAYIQQIANPVAKQFVTELNSIPTQGQIDAQKYHDLGVEMGKHVGGGMQDAVKNAIKGLVEKALAPTAVTAEDVAATQAGKYVDKWDEFARRADAVAKGTDPSKYGSKFAEQLKALGMTAEQAAAGFRDFSLFADPKNLNLVDWGPVVADVQHNIDMLIGKANLAKEAFDQVWDSLSPSKKAQLAGALGVDPTDANNAQKVFEAMSGGEAKESAKTTSEIAANIQIISGIHTAIVDIQKSSTFDANLAEVLDDISQIPKSADVVVTMTYQTVGVPAEEGGGAQPPAPTGPGVPMQHGGSFVVPPGFDENYPIRLSSGEQVTVLPANMSDADLDYFIKQNFATLERLYNANPQYWMGIAASHPGWGKRDWYEFIFGNQWGHFKLSDLGIPPAGAGGKPTTSRPGDSYHGPVYNAPVQYSFTVYPRDYESLMRDARAAAAHGA